MDMANILAVTVNLFIEAFIGAINKWGIIPCILFMVLYGIITFNMSLLQFHLFTLVIICGIAELE